MVGEQAAVRWWWFDLVGFVARAQHVLGAWRAEVRGDVGCQGGKVPSLYVAFTRHQVITTIALLTLSCLMINS